MKYTLSYFRVWQIIILFSLCSCGNKEDFDPYLTIPNQNGFFYNFEGRFYPTPQAYVRVLSSGRIDFCVASSSLVPNLEGQPTTFEGQDSWITFASLPTDDQGNLPSGRLEDGLDFQEFLIDPQGVRFDGNHFLEDGTLKITVNEEEGIYEITYELEGIRINSGSERDFSIKGRYVGSLEQLQEAEEEGEEEEEGEGEIVFPNSNGFFFDDENDFFATSQGFLVEATVVNDQVRTLILGGDSVKVSALSPTFRIDGDPRVLFSVEVDQNGNLRLGRYYPQDFIDSNPDVDHVGTYTYMDVLRTGDDIVRTGDPALSPNYLDVAFDPSSGMYSLTYVISGQVNVGETGTQVPFEVSGIYTGTLQELSF